VTLLRSIFFLFVFGVSWFPTPTSGRDCRSACSRTGACSLFARGFDGNFASAEGGERYLGSGVGLGDLVPARVLGV
jgi:hypothetical protein